MVMCLINLTEFILFQNNKRTDSMFTNLQGDMCANHSMLEP